MAHLYCHLLALVHSPVNLTHRPRRYGFLFKVLENLPDLLPIGLPKIFFSGFEGVRGRIFPEVLKLFCHFRSDDVPAVAEVLEGLDEDDSCAFDCLYEEIPPVVFGSLEEK